MAQSIATFQGAINKVYSTDEFVKPFPYPRAEINGLRNIISGIEPARTKDPRDPCTYAYTNFKINIEGDPMYGCTDNDTCCDTTPMPEAAGTTLKHLRREAKRIRKQIAAVEKQDKRNRKAKAKQAVLQAQRDADRETARRALRRVANDPARGFGAVEAARELLNNYNL